MSPFKQTSLALALAATTWISTQAAEAGSLENLERERALTIDMLLDRNLTAEDRSLQTRDARARLADLERVAMRDDSLLGNTAPTVRVAFENYDLTFLVHSSVEQNVTMLELWLDQVGLSTADIMSARAGRKW